MNDAPQDSTVQRSTEPEASEEVPGLEWVRRNWARNVLAHEGIMLDRIQRVQRFSEIAARNAMTGNMKDTTGLPDYSKDHGMGVAIGDRIVNHYYRQSEQNTPPAAEPPDKKSKAVGTLGKVAIAAALVGSGAGAGGLAMWALDKLSTPPAVETSVDAGVEYEGRIKVR